jgi:hypothetical protein
MNIELLSSSENPERSGPPPTKRPTDEALTADGDALLNSGGSSKRFCTEQIFSTRESTISDASYSFQTGFSTALQSDEWCWDSEITAAPTTGWTAPVGSMHLQTRGAPTPQHVLGGNAALNVDTELLHSQQPSQVSSFWTPGTGHFGGDLCSEAEFGQHLDSMNGPMLVENYGQLKLDGYLGSQPEFGLSITTEDQNGYHASSGGLAIPGQLRNEEIDLGSHVTDGDSGSGGIDCADSSSVAEIDTRSGKDDDEVMEETTAGTTPELPLMESGSGEEESVVDPICDTCFGLVSIRFGHWEHFMSAGITRRCVDVGDSFLSRNFNSVTNSSTTRGVGRSRSSFIAA